MSVSEITVYLIGPRVTVGSVVHRRVERLALKDPCSCKEKAEACRPSYAVGSVDQTCGEIAREPAECSDDEYQGGCRCACGGEGGDESSMSDGGPKADREKERVADCEADAR